MFDLSFFYNSRLVFIIANMLPLIWNREAQSWWKITWNFLRHYAFDIWHQLWHTMFLNGDIQWFKWCRKTITLSRGRQAIVSFRKTNAKMQRCTNVIVNASFTRSLMNVAHYWLIFLVNWNFCEWTWLIFLVNWNLSSQRCMEGGHNLTQIIHYLSQIIHYYNFFFSNFHKKVFHFIFRKKNHAHFWFTPWTFPWTWVIVAHIFTK